jgi:hypothetical protein
MEPAYVRDHVTMLHGAVGFTLIWDRSIHPSPMTLQIILSLFHFVSKWGSNLATASIDVTTFSLLY